MLDPVSGDGRDELEAGPDGALGVVLLRDRGAPDRHDGVANELFHNAPVPGDDGPGELEVAREELAHLLGVVALRQGREPDQVAEQHRDVAELGAARARRLVVPREGADAPPVATGVTVVPHSLQNFAWEGRTVPQLAQFARQGAAALEAEFAPEGFSDPHCPQSIGDSLAHGFEEVASGGADSNEFLLTVVQGRRWTHPEAKCPDTTAARVGKAELGEARLRSCCAAAARQPAGARFHEVRLGARAGDRTQTDTPQT